MAPSAWALAGAFAGLLAALIVFAPASWLAAALQRASNSQILLHDPRGTVWEGSAQLVLTAGPGSTDAAALPGRVAWSLRPRWDGLSLRLSAACCTPRPLAASLRWRPGRLRLDLEESDLRWPAAVLSGLGTPWNTLQFEGEMHMTSRALSVEWSAGRLAVEGQAELTAQNLSSRLSTLRPMGSYRITLQGGTAPTLRLHTIEGSLQLTGGGQWVGRRLQFQGEASAAADREAALSNLLNIIGRRSGPRSIITIG
jgi:general secretion pathway protein N